MYDDDYSAKKKNNNILQPSEINFNDVMSFSAFYNIKLVPAIGAESSVFP